MDNFLKRVVVRVAVIVVIIIAFVLPKLLQHKLPDKMPGDENTYRVVTLYNSLYPDGGKVFGEIRELARLYEDVPAFVYVDTSDESEITGNLRLMAGRNYTVYFLDKDDAIITLWYDSIYIKDEFIKVIEQCFGVKPKE